MCESFLKYFWGLIADDVSKAVSQGLLTYYVPCGTLGLGIDRGSLEKPMSRAGITAEVASYVVASHGTTPGEIEQRILNSAH